MDYIDKDAVLDLVEKGHLISNGNYQKVKKLIEDIPAADVKPVVHSCWDKHGYACPCLNCGWDAGFANTLLERTVTYGYKYCPGCGARMDGVGDG